MYLFNEIMFQNNYSFSLLFSHGLVRNETAVKTVLRTPILIYSAIISLNLLFYLQNSSQYTGKYVGIRKIIICVVSTLCFILFNHGPVNQCVII